VTSAATLLDPKRNFDIGSSEQKPAIHFDPESV